MSHKQNNERLRWKIADLKFFEVFNQPLFALFIDVLVFVRLDHEYTTGIQKRLFKET